MDDFYQRIQLNGEQEDSSSIVGTLSGIMSGKLRSDLRLVNYYHQVPVSYAASVLSVEKDSAEFLVHQHQAVAISRSKLTVLKSSHFPKDVIACVSYMNVERSLILFNRFSYGMVRAERRMSVRVGIDQQLAAHFSCSRGRVSGVLRDISLSGLSLTLDADPGLSPSEKGQLSLELPGGAVTLAASLLKTSKLERGHRAVFEIAPGRAEEERLGKLIMQRQVEIIRELKEHTDPAPSASSPKRAY